MDLFINVKKWIALQSGFAWIWHAMNIFLLVYLGAEIIGYQLRLGLPWWQLQLANYVSLIEALAIIAFFLFFIAIWQVILDGLPAKDELKEWLLLLYLVSPLLLMYLIGSIGQQPIYFTNLH